MVAISKIAAVVAGLFASSAHGLRHLRARDLSNATIPLSPDQLRGPALGSPGDNPLTAVAVGFGVQNYTCGVNNTFISTGAVAELLDISDLASNQTFISSVHESAFNLWSTGGFANLTIQQVITNVSVSTSNAGVLAQLYYINEGTVLGLSPVWDFRATPNFEGVENAIMVGTALWELPDVDPTENIPWFHYLNLDGAIASEVYQIYTVGGVAPPSCVSGTTDDISVKYAAQYWFYGGSLGLGSNSPNPSNSSTPSNPSNPSNPSGSSNPSSLPSNSKGPTKCRSRGSSPSSRNSRRH